MKRLLLIIICLFCLLPALHSQSETNAHMWLDSSMKIKKPIVLGFIMGALTMKHKMVDEFLTIGRFDEWKKDEPAAEIKDKNPGRSAQQEPWERDIPVLVAAMDAFYRRPENKDVEMTDALYTVIFEPETAAKKTDNDKK